MNIIEKSVKEWLLLQCNMTEQQIEMNKILLVNKIDKLTEEHAIINYEIKQNQIILINDEDKHITINLNIHPTIKY